MPLLTAVYTVYHKFNPNTGIVGEALDESAVKKFRSAFSGIKFTMRTGNRSEYVGTLYPGQRSVYLLPGPANAILRHAVVPPSEGMDGCIRFSVPFFVF